MKTKKIKIIRSLTREIRRGAVQLRKARFGTLDTSVIEHELHHKKVMRNAFLSIYPKGVRDV